MPQATTHSLAALAQAVEGRLQGDGERRITGVNGLKEARPGELSFFNNHKYRQALQQTQASAVLVNESTLAMVEGRDAIVVPDPYLAFARISTIFHPPPRFAAGVHPAAIVEEGAEIDPTATVMANAYVGPGARVGARAVLFPGVFVGAESTVGEEALLYPNVVLRERCSIGARSIVHAGAVIGADGFGFAFDLANGRHFKIPQAGTVEIAPDVEIGANTAIDRGTLGPTKIGQGVKIDNLVQVAHNVEVGPLCILCSQAGIAGSTKLGTGVILGGQVGVVNHVQIADGVRVVAQSGVMSNVEEAGDYAGSPIASRGEWLRSSAAFNRMPEALKDLAKLKKQVAELEAKLAALEEGK
ncbi:MAG: UDP-3-O-(3-hydroxymyristoyl)glucosamine N-acyltransferase [Myxococcales bacterium]